MDVQIDLSEDEEAEVSTNHHGLSDTLIQINGFHMILNSDQWDLLYQAAKDWHEEPKTGE